MRMEPHSERQPVEVAVISLKGAAPRRRLMEEQFTRLPLPWHFFDAHGSLVNLAPRYDPATLYHKFGRTLSVPELGCWSSHYTVIEEFLQRGSSDYLLVFEDDVIFDTAFALPALVDLCRARGIHYMRLFGMYYADAVRLSFFFDRSIIRYKSSPAGAQSYILSRTGAERMLAALGEIEATIDLAMDHFWKTGLPIYAVFPFPVIERYSPSSVPMQAATPLDRMNEAIWTANRVCSRLSKLRENVSLAASDRKFRREALRFQQILTEDNSGAAS
ncbi:glycosyltransferase family 25 protein (plasmid) [Salipiger sp. H15]|uniref:Glycosyltransferase family 25 protein n=1 Tax=Alloyangia sp. H15 TaxID=3029062 RepID=A0AAU8AT14_9RHOB